VTLSLETALREKKAAEEVFTTSLYLLLVFTTISFLLSLGTALREKKAAEEVYLYTSLLLVFTTTPLYY
jgi:hypothetical protein